MSEIRGIIGGAIADRESTFADQVKNLRTGLFFLAEIQEIEDTSLNTELGIDPRATDIFYVRDKTVSILANDIWSALGSNFMVLPRNAPDNPSSVQLKVFCTVGVKGKDDWA